MKLPTAPNPKPNVPHQAGLPPRGAWAVFLALLFVNYLLAR